MDAVAKEFWNKPEAPDNVSHKLEIFLKKSLHRICRCLCFFPNHWILQSNTQCGPLTQYSQQYLGTESINLFQKNQYLHHSQSGGIIMGLTLGPKCLYLLSQWVDDTEHWQRKQRHVSPTPMGGISFPMCHDRIRTGALTRILIKCWSTAEQGLDENKRVPLLWIRQNS